MFVGGGVGGEGDSRLCCMFHRVREGGEGRRVLAQ